MTQLTHISVTSDFLVSYSTEDNDTAAMDALKALLAETLEDAPPLNATIDEPEGGASTAVPDAPVVADDTLIATYRSGIQDVKFKKKFIEYRDNGEKVRLDYDDADIPEYLDDPFNIDMAFYGAGWSEELLDAFVAASEFLSDMIGAGLAADSTNSTTTGEELQIDDLVIEVSLSEGDGVGNIVGGAEVEAVRSSDGVTPDGLPVLALMDFDIDDANALLELGIWDDLVLHEMIHALGFGTPLWSTGNVSGENYFAFLPQGTFPFPALLGQPIYQNLDEFDQNTTNVAQVAAAEGSDTTPSLSGIAVTPFISGMLFDEFTFLVSTDELDQLGHWNEAEYGNALMTPILSLEQNVLLDITLASLQDMGYDITLDLVAEDNPLSEGIDLVAENNVKFTDFAEDVLLLG